MSFPDGFGIYEVQKYQPLKIYVKDISLHILVSNPLEYCRQRHKSQEAVPCHREKAADHPYKSLELWDGSPNNTQYTF